MIAAHADADHADRNRCCASLAPHQRCVVVTTSRLVSRLISQLFSRLIEGGSARPGERNRRSGSAADQGTLCMLGCGVALRVAAGSACEQQAHGARAGQSRVRGPRGRAATAAKPTRGGTPAVTLLDDTTAELTDFAESGHSFKIVVYVYKSGSSKNSSPGVFRLRLSRRPSFLVTVAPPNRRPA